MTRALPRQSSTCALNDWISACRSFSARYFYSISICCNFLNIVNVPTHPPSLHIHFMLSHIRCPDFLFLSSCFASVSLPLFRATQQFQRAIHVIASSCHLGKSLRLHCTTRHTSSSIYKACHSTSKKIDMAGSAPTRPSIAGGPSRISLKTGLPPGAVPYYVFLDFDKTITMDDTIELLSTVSAAMQETPTRRAEVLDAWEDCKGEYMRDYDEFSSTYRPTKIQRTTMQQELEYQNVLRKVDLDSIMRVSASNVYLYPKPPKFNIGFYSAGRIAVQKGFVKIRRGFEDFIKALEARNVNEMVDDHSCWHVISVNFCQPFVAGCVEAAVPSFQDWHRVQVVSNEIDEYGLIVAPAMTIVSSAPFLGILIMPPFLLPYGRSCPRSCRGLPMIHNYSIQAASLRVVTY